MKVISNQIRTITIEGVDFTPEKGGVIVPDNKIEALQSNFFFKALVADNSFIVKKQEAKEDTELSTKTNRKAR